MALESWLTPTFTHASAVVTNSSSLQAAIAARLVATGWTNPSANVYKSPNATRWIQLTFSQPDSAKLEISMLDYASRTATSRRVGAVGNPETWQIHVNTYGMVVWNTTGTGWAFAGCLDHFPKPQTSHTLDTYFGGYHTTANAVAADEGALYQSASYTGGFDTAAAKTPIGPQNSYHVTKNLSGIRRDFPINVWTPVDASYRNYAGRWPQAVLIDISVPKDSEFTVPLDATVTGTFKSTGVTLTYIATTRRVAVRVGV